MYFHKFYLPLKSLKNKFTTNEKSLKIQSKYELENSKD